MSQDKSVFFSCGDSIMKPVAISSDVKAYIPDEDDEPYDDWQKRGSVIIENEKTLHASKLIMKIYEFNCVGANCHIVLDDQNIDDDDIEFCIGAAKENYHEQPKENNDAEFECMNLFLTMTLDERCSAIEMAANAGCHNQKTN